MYNWCEVSSTLACWIKNMTDVGVTGRLSRMSNEVLSLTQVRISYFVRLNTPSGSVLTSWSLLGNFFLPLSTPLPLLCKNK